MELNRIKDSTFLQLRENPIWDSLLSVISEKGVSSLQEQLYYNDIRSGRISCYGTTVTYRELVNSIPEDEGEYEPYMDEDYYTSCIVQFRQNVSVSSWSETQPDILEPNATRQDMRLILSSDSGNTLTTYLRGLCYREDYFVVDLSSSYFAVGASAPEYQYTGNTLSESFLKANKAAITKNRKIFFVAVSTVPTDTPRYIEANPVAVSFKADVAVAEAVFNGISNGMGESYLSLSRPIYAYTSNVTVEINNFSPNTFNGDLANLYGTKLFDIYSLTSLYLANQQLGNAVEDISFQYDFDKTDDDSEVVTYKEYTLRRCSFTTGEGTLAQGSAFVTLDYIFLHTDTTLIPAAGPGTGACYDILTGITTYQGSSYVVLELDPADPAAILAYDHGTATILNLTLPTWGSLKDYVANIESGSWELTEIKIRRIFDTFQPSNILTKLICNTNLQSWWDRSKPDACLTENVQWSLNIVNFVYNVSLAGQEVMVDFYGNDTFNINLPTSTYLSFYAPDGVTYGNANTVFQAPCSVKFKVTGTLPDSETENVIEAIGMHGTKLTFSFVNMIEVTFSTSLQSDEKTIPYKSTSITFSVQCSSSQSWTVVVEEGEGTSIVTPDWVVGSDLGVSKQGSISNSYIRVLDNMPSITQLAKIRTCTFYITYTRNGVAYKLPMLVLHQECLIRFDVVGNIRYNGDMMYKIFTNSECPGLQITTHPNIQWCIYAVSDIYSAPSRGTNLIKEFSFYLGEEPQETPWDTEWISIMDSNYKFAISDSDTVHPAESEYSDTPTALSSTKSFMWIAIGDFSNTSFVFDTATFICLNPRAGIDGIATIAEWKQTLTTTTASSEYSDGMNYFRYKTNQTFFTTATPLMVMESSEFDMDFWPWSALNVPDKGLSPNSPKALSFVNGRGNPYNYYLWNLAYVTPVRYIGSKTLTPIKNSSFTPFSFLGPNPDGSDVERGAGNSSNVSTKIIPQFYIVYGICNSYVNSSSTPESLTKEHYPYPFSALNALGDTRLFPDLSYPLNYSGSSGTAVAQTDYIEGSTSRGRRVRAIGTVLQVYYGATPSAPTQASDLINSSVIENTLDVELVDARTLWVAIPDGCVISSWVEAIFGTNVTFSSGAIINKDNNVYNVYYVTTPVVQTTINVVTIVYNE